MSRELEENIQKDGRSILFRLIHTFNLRPFSKGITRTVVLSCKVSRIKMLRLVINKKKKQKRKRQDGKMHKHST